MSQLEGMVPDGVRALKDALHQAEVSLDVIGEELWNILRGAWLPTASADTIRQTAAWASGQGPEINRRLVLLERMELARPELFGAGKPPISVDEAMLAPGTPLPTIGNVWDRIGQQLQDIFDPNLVSSNPMAEQAKGTVESVAGLGQLVIDYSPTRAAIDFMGWQRSVNDLTQSLMTAIQNPAEFGKALLDWDTWASNPDRAFGRLIPDILAAVASAGSSSTASAGTRVVGTLGRAAKSTFRRKPSTSTSLMPGRLADDIGKGPKRSDGIGAEPPSAGAGGTGSAPHPGTRYGPLNPGPLADKPDLMTTFRSSSYWTVTTTKPVTLYRVYGGTSKELGAYWTTVKPSGPVQSILDSALFTKWGNTATKWVEIRVPPGITYYEGIAAEQGGLAGGGSQVVITQKVDPSWIVNRGEFPMRQHD
ncbi:hypothetical protein [Nonomuraea sp. JJY05]|uniref:hypothetical protein n=1 Tax=Nonomuraea sp. JJY05 TaxID=3350255 RepID=UPI00373FA402